MPRPRFHLIRFHGALAPNAKLRAEIVPREPINTGGPCNDHAHTAHGSTPTRISWARLLKRVFEIDIEHCPHCGGRLKIIAAIEDPAVIVGSSPTSACLCAPRRDPRHGHCPCSKRPDSHPPARWHRIRFSRWPGIALGLHSPHRRIGLNISTASGWLTAAYSQKLNTLSAHPFD